MARALSLWERSKVARDPVLRAHPWARSELIGRLIELSGQGASAALTVAFGLVVEAQQQGEPVVWVSATASMFFPPDAAAGGVDLEAMAVVRTGTCAEAGRAADRLLRSAAFGLVVLDLGPRAALAMGLQARLVKLAQKHEAVVVCLTEKSLQTPSLSPLVSLRCAAQRARPNERGSGFVCDIVVIKDKRRGPRWKYEEQCHGPPGLR